MNSIATYRAQLDRDLALPDSWDKEGYLRSLAISVSRVVWSAVQQEAREIYDRAIAEANRIAEALIARGVQP